MKIIEKLKSKFSAHCDKCHDKANPKIIMMGKSKWYHFETLNCKCGGKYKMHNEIDKSAKPTKIYIKEKGDE